MGLPLRMVICGLSEPSLLSTENYSISASKTHTLTHTHPNYPIIYYIIIICIISLYVQVFF